MDAVPRRSLVCGRLGASLDEMVALDRASLEASPYRLSQDDLEGLVKFAADCSRFLGTALRAISLQGESGAPTISVLFTDERQRPGRVYSYEWRLGDLDPPDDANPLAVQLVDYLGNNIVEDLETTPGLPIWEPDDDGIIHVQVTSERYRAWPQEWRKLGRPWRDQEGRLRYADR
jgi:hypothetical protein